MILRDFFTEAANPAQQAAIAIAMKKAHKKPKTEGMAEGGAETSWKRDTETITLQDILELTKHIQQINLPINDNLKSKLLHWDGNTEEIERINQVTVSKQFPILIMLDEQGQIDWILDGNHRLHKAIKAQAETIPAKLIKPSDLNDKAKKIFNIKEQGVAEACWPGYHKDGMKTMFGKRYPNCVKNKKVSEQGMDAFIAETLNQKNADEIRRIQQMLNKKFKANLDVDGVLGPLTRRSIRKFLPDANTAPAPNPERTTAVQGLKTKPVAEQQCPKCGGPMFSELMINEKQDACYYKVKSRYKVWPSAYASGALVQCRKKGAANWGNKSKK